MEKNHAQRTVNNKTILAKKFQSSCSITFPLDTNLVPFDSITEMDINSDTKCNLPWKDSDHYIPVPILCSWDYSTWHDWLEKNSCFLDGEIQVYPNEEKKTEETEPSLMPPNAENWVIGTLGSKNALLIFRSSALTAANNPAVRAMMPAAKLHITYKTQNAETKLISKLLEAHGLTEVPITATDYNLLWTGCHIKPEILRNLTSHQRVNHFPRSYELTRKDRLYKNIERMQHGKGFRQFDFIPQTFVMPAEYKDLCNAHYRIRGPWIIKPVASSRGRGIHIVNSPEQVALEEPVVVAKYIGNPLLIGGHKCDLRLYVVVTSFDPLLIYLYEEGLVRFATVPYDSSPRQLWNPCMHLCNYSINKYHCDYVKSDDPAAEDVGHKWTLSALLRHLRCEGRDTALLMEQIEDLVVKSMLSCASSIISAVRMFVQHPSNCFELYGFDILIDNNLKPWLLEVNLSPSLGCDTPLDVRLKSAMLSDLLTLVGIPAIDPILRHQSSVYGSMNSSIGSKLSNSRMRQTNSCRRVYSAETVNSCATIHNSKIGSKNSGGGPTSLSPDEHRILRIVKTQYERRGGFVRIFPTSNTWSKYSQYLDTTTGIPLTSIQVGTIPSFNLVVNHNYNLLLHTHIYGSSKHLHEKEHQPDRLDRYERILQKGPKEKIDMRMLSSVTSTRSEKHTEFYIKNDVKRLLEAGYKLTQGEARRAFSNYLICVLQGLSERSNEKTNQGDLVWRFLQRASSQLRNPYIIKMPTQQLSEKDRNAMIAKYLSDFLTLYNKETELYADLVDRPNHIPNKLFNEFLSFASENELEEALMLHMERNVTGNINVLSGSLQLLMRCLPISNTNTRSTSIEEKKKYRK